VRTPLDIAKACYQAYVDKDRAAIEALLDDEYHFSSPLDNALDRETYFNRCWANSGQIAAFNYIHTFEDADRAVVVYEGRTSSGKRFRNCEVHTVRGGKLIATEVYFGWDLPHKAPVGGFLNDSDEG
jgi:ketosteroid isomerase-like protein